MIQINLTGPDILKDIEGYQSRLRKAQDKLSKLPIALKGFKARQKLEAEVRHVKGLISLAQEALEGLGSG